MIRLSEDRCYEAVRSRDRRFEGVFVLGVTSTGLFCRPGCPAPIPKRANVRFFPAAAAATEAGFRPCARCRPELSVQAWPTTSRTVTRALRLLSEDPEAGSDVEQLAARLGIGARHLRRLFDRHLGASPVTVRQTQRTHFARRLLDETDLPMTEVALAAGFSSVRRFNEAMKEVFRVPPSTLRGRRTSPADHGVSVKLPFRAPYDWEGVRDFLAARAVEGLEDVGGDRYRRTVEIDGRRGVVEVAPVSGEPALRVTLQGLAVRDLMSVVERVRRVFDLSTDPGPIRRRLGRDAVLGAAWSSNPGLRVVGGWDGFEVAVRAVLGQQVSLSAARTLLGRLVRRYGRRLDGEWSGPMWTFPRPCDLRRVDARSIGLPRSRAATLRALAREMDGGRLILDPGADAEAARRGLESMSGIGAWTSGYVAMRALGDPDGFPDGDLGLRRALSDDGAPVSIKELRARAEGWRPWRAYATVSLWSMRREDP